MAVDLDLLKEDFKLKIIDMIANCKKLGIEMRPYDGLRTALSQGKLWRQSRTSEEVKKKIADLKTAKANFLASCIEDAGPSSGPHVTNAIPGYSWHQWGEAVDLFWVVNGKANWSTTELINGKNGYHVMADEAVKLGLTAGLSWTSFPDAPHIQLRSEDSPDDVYTMTEINDQMKADSETKGITKKEFNLIDKLIKEFDPKLKLPQPTAYELPETSTSYIRYGTYHWGTDKTIAFAKAVATSWQTNGSGPKLNIGDISAQVFANTTGHYGHKTGTHVDFDLPGNLMDDPDYTVAKQEKCAALICKMIILGAKRVLYNDLVVKDNVNKWATDNRYAGRVDTYEGHGNHIHAEMPL